MNRQVFRPVLPDRTHAEEQAEIARLEALGACRT